MAKLESYTVIARYRSSKGKKWHAVSMDNNGNISCSCPAWIYKSGVADGEERSCKHTNWIRVALKVKGDARSIINPSVPPPKKTQTTNPDNRPRRKLK